MSKRTGHAQYRFCYVRVWGNTPNRTEIEVVRQRGVHDFSHTRGNVAELRRQGHDAWIEKQTKGEWQWHRNETKP